MTHNLRLLLTSVPFAILAGITLAVKPLADEELLMPIVFAAFFLLTMSGVISALGSKRAGLILGALAIFSLAVGGLAVWSGFPYGYFWYGDFLGPKILNQVPVLLPLVWIPILLGANAGMNLAGIKKGGLSLLAIVALVALAFLVIDPAAVAQDLWTYRNGGVYYDVPLSAVIGWLFTGTLFAFLFESTIHSRKVLDGCILALGLWTGLAFGNSFIIPGIIGVLLVVGGIWVSARHVRQSSQTAVPTEQTERPISV